MSIVNDLAAHLAGELGDEGTARRLAALLCDDTLAGRRRSHPLENAGSVCHREAEMIGGVR